MNTQAPSTTQEIREQIEALDLQIEAVGDEIGQCAISWRAAAANPSALARAAERLTVLERQRDMLNRAKGEAENALAQMGAQANAERVNKVVSETRELVLSALDQRVQLGVQLAKTVDQLGDVLQELFDQGTEIAKIFHTSEPASKISGVTNTDVVRSVNAEDLQYVINQVLAWRLGKRLWAVETSPASRGISVADRVAREAGPVRTIFENGVAERIDLLKVSA